MPILAIDVVKIYRSTGCLSVLQGFTEGYQTLSAEESVDIDDTIVCRKIITLFVFQLVTQVTTHMMLLISLLS